MRFKCAIVFLLIASILIDLCGGQNLIVDFIDRLLQTDIPNLIGQRPSNENGTREEFKDYLLNDNSNENIGRASVQEIILRSGFKYENHYVSTTDGYITQLVRMVNPLADKRKLKQPPVMLFHGGSGSPITYVSASAIQHHPEKYPRQTSDGPITSWNRSLAFMLANNGFDVWLVGTRGAGSPNQGHLKYRGPKSIDLSGAAPDKSRVSFLENIDEASEYWNFCMDEIVKFEMPRQIDRVLELTGASKVTLFGYSISPAMTLMLLSQRPSDARKVHNLVSMAPIINSTGINRLNRALCEMVLHVLPEKLGTLLMSEIFLTRTTGNLIQALNANRVIRYSLTKPLLALISGPSAKYLSLVEPAFGGHTGNPVSFREVKQVCQQAFANKLQNYDYGKRKNKLVYGTWLPPAADLSELYVDHWLIISGENDMVATQYSVEQLMRDVKHPKVYESIAVPGYNHLDLVAALDNDIKINQPILEFLTKTSLPSLSGENRYIDHRSNSIKDINLLRFVPKSTFNSVTRYS